jgi:hypothetical protein
MDQLQFSPQHKQRGNTSAQSNHLAEVSCVTGFLMVLE